MRQAPDRRETFRLLHESGCFVMPNPWDVGTARVLAQIGFPAIATTSSGLAWSLGRSRQQRVARRDRAPSQEPSRPSVDVPVNADFESGFAIMPADVASNVAAAVTTGVAGLSIEDSTGDQSNPLFDFTLSVDRIRAARPRHRRQRHRRPADRSLRRLHRGRPDLAETIRRLTAYAEAGADCLYAPGIRDKA